MVTKRVASDDKRPSKTPRLDRNLTEERTNEDEPQSIGTKVENIEKRTEAIDRVVRRTAVWIYHFPNMLQVLPAIAEKINMRWLDIFDSKNGSNRMKIDFVTLPEKLRITQFLKNLAPFNKERKSPTMWKDELTPRQLLEKKKRFE
uniref:Uncharacterized protein n=1 Tax=Romanomermis culicivorax TaxID=13658 RepID=A0A915K3G8_ROMCU